MGNTIWSKLNNRSKSKKSNYEIALKTNIPEHKVKEIMEGTRVLPTDRVDSFVGAIQEDNTVERSLNKAKIVEWINNTDLRELRAKFNYTSQVDLAKAFNIDSSVICRIEHKKLDHISDSFLFKYYNFFQDELNKKIDKHKATTEDSKVKAITKSNPRSFRNSDILNKVNIEEIIDWYNNFDFNSYLETVGLSRSEFVTKLGYKKSSSSLISDLANHRINPQTTGSRIILKAYAFINNLLDENKDTVEPQTDPEVSYTSQNIYVESEPQEEPIKEDLGHNEDHYKLEEDTKAAVADYKLISEGVINESKPQTDFLQVDMGGLNNLTPTDLEKVTMYRFTWDNKVKEVEELTKKNKELELQITRYEKLIDMIK